MFAILNVDLRIDECPCTGQTWRYLEAVQDTGIFRCGIFTNRDFTIYVLQLTFAYIHVPFATLGICGDNCKKLQKFSFAKHVDLFLKLNAYCFPTSPALVSTGTNSSSSSSFLFDVMLPISNSKQSSKHTCLVSGRNGQNMSKPKVWVGHVLSCCFHTIGQKRPKHQNCALLLARYVSL